MIMLFLNLQITKSDIRPHIKWAVSLMIERSGPDNMRNTRFSEQISNLSNQYIQRFTLLWRLIGLLIIQMVLSLQSIRKRDIMKCQTVRKYMTIIMEVL